MYCETRLSYSAKFYQPISCLPYHLAHLNFIVRFIQAYAQVAAFDERPVLLPYHFSVPRVILCSEVARC